MKRFTRVLAVLTALILVATMIPAAFAAGVAPGKKASVSFTYKDICGIDGEFTFSNPSIISGITYSPKTTMIGSVQDNVAYFYGSNATSITITVSFKISANAKDGDKCVVSFRHETADKQGNMSDWKTDSKTVVVETPAPVTPIDYTELKNQIAAAKDLKEGEYTGASWDALQKALSDAEKALSSKDQKTVDAAAAALAEAIKNLAKLDYTALIEAIDKTEEFLASDAMGGKGAALVEALQNAKNLLSNAKDQDSIDKAAAALTTALAELADVLEQMANKPAEKPTGEFCNISIHYVWPVLFFISLAVNIALVVLFFVRRKKNEKEAE